MMTLTTKGRQILEQIQVKLLQFPEKFDIHSWSRSSSCGTTLCIGGYACQINHPKGFFKQGNFHTAKGKGGQYPGDVAAKALTGKGFDASRGMDLMFLNFWPVKYHEALMKARTARQRAIVGIQRIQSLLDDGV